MFIWHVFIQRGLCLFDRLCWLEPRGAKMMQLGVAFVETNNQFGKSRARASVSKEAQWVRVMIQSREDLI